MAQPTGTHATNDMTGIREDLTDVIYEISPVEVPFLSSVEHTEATAVVHSWQTHALTAAANNAAIEGDDAPQTTATATTLVSNNTQISTLDARVTGTGQAVNTAGRANELDFQVLARGKELKRDMETALLSNKAKVTGNDTLARELAGIISWIVTNTSTGTGGSDAGTADGTNTATDGTQRAFQESQLKSVLSSIATQGGFPNTLMLGAFNRQKFSEFTGGSTGMQKSEDSVLHATFDIYASDFGSLRVVFNRFQRSRDALILEMEKWAVPFMPGRNMAEFPLAKTGDSDAVQILSEYTLEARNEAASGVVLDLSTS